MFNLSSFDLSLYQWLLLALCAVLVGIAKTGIMGVGILAVPLFASVFPAKESVGVLLPILIFADLFAVVYYRRHARWAHIIRLIPYTLIGIIVGYFAMAQISDGQLKPVIGAIVLVMLGLKLWQSRQNSDIQNAIPSHWAFAVAFGFLAGLTTIMANAAGPIMIIYLLAMALPKTEFVGTGAWFFFIINWIKVPFVLRLGLITPQSLQLNLTLFPLIIIGAVIGIIILKRIPQRLFNVLVQILAAAAAIKLFF